MKKTPLVLFALVMVMAAFALAPVCGVMAADSTTLTVSVQIEGPDKNISYDSDYKVTLEKKADEVSAYDVVTQFMKDKKIEYVSNSPGYIESVNDYGELSFVQGSETIYTGWLFAVNGEISDKGMDATMVSDGDSVTLAYSVMPMANVAIATIVYGNDGTYQLMLVVNTQDAAWKPVLAPLAGATVTFDGNKLDGTTDAEGLISVPASMITAGTHKLQVERYADGIAVDADHQLGDLPNGTKIPNLVRLPANSGIDVSLFKDLDNYNWAKENIYGLVTLGIVNGKTLDTYAPGEGFTRAQLVKMLFCVAGEDEGDFDGKTDFTDVKADAWYAPYVQWAAESGVTEGLTATTFGPMEFVTREQAFTFISDI